MIEPLFLSTGLFLTDPAASRARYCTYNSTFFTGFTDIDRQTELNDDDGTLTGLVGPTAQTGLIGSVSVNQDTVFQRTAANSGMPIRYQRDSSELRNESSEVRGDGSYQSL